MGDLLFLVADVGGTNTRVGLARGTLVDTASIRRFRNRDHAGLEDVLRAYLAENGAKPDAAAAAAAGPLQDGGVKLTNLAWHVTPDGISEATGCEKASVLNDLQAQGHALPFIEAGNLTTLIEAPEGPETAPRLVLGVGTGLNSAVALPHAGRVFVPASETGHIDLPIATRAHFELGAWLAARHGFAAAEEALSGRGVAHLYAWACDRAGVPNTPEADAPAVMERLAAGDPQAVVAAQTFAELLGGLAGSLALIQLPFGGVYIVGGMARAFTPQLNDLGFADAFRAKGRFSDYMRQFAVHVVEDDYAALTGCAAYLIDRV
ncbi:glucokinase [Pseudaestuariivita sp.]|uniref:glucokinase n=1 Tax=Pseudaestuariivita sp. TaxID=2211669 RepID=UPI004059983D